MDSLLYGAEIPGHGRVSFEYYGVPQQLELFADGTLRCGSFSDMFKSRYVEWRVAPEELPTVATILANRQPLYERFAFQCSTFYAAWLVVASIAFGGILLVLLADSVKSSIVVIGSIAMTWMTAMLVLAYRKRHGHPSRTHDVLLLCQGACTLVCIYTIHANLNFSTDLPAAIDTATHVIFCFLAIGIAPFISGAVTMNLVVMATRAYAHFLVLTVYTRVRGFTPCCLFVALAVVPILVVRASRQLFVPRRRCAALVVWDAVRARWNRAKQD